MIEMNDYDVVIVGAGIASGLIAKSLGEAKKKVLILEAGQKIPTSRENFMETFYNALAKIPSSPYPNLPNAPHPTVIQDNSGFPEGGGKVRVENGKPVSYFDQTGPVRFGSSYERTGGGTTWHWLGTSLRFLPADFKMSGPTNGVLPDWPISYDDLESWYGKAEFEIGISANVADQDYLGIHFHEGYEYPMEGLPMSLVDQWFAAKMDNQTLDGVSVKVSPTPQGRNGPYRGDYYNGRRMCAGNTNCIPICPIQAKYDATITLNDALQTGYVTIAYQSVVDKILKDEDGAISGIHFIRYQDKEAGPTDEGIATGKVYVGAAHAIEMAKVLLMSDVANRSGQVGKNLMDHPVFRAWGRSPEGTELFPFRGPLATSGIESLRDTGRSEHAAYRIEIGNDGWAWPEGSPNSDVANALDKRLFGKALRAELANGLERQFRVGFLIEQGPSCESYIVPSAKYTDSLGIPVPEVHYDLDTYTKNGFEHAFQVAQELMTKLGAVDTQFDAQAGDHVPPEESGPGTQFVYNGVTYNYGGAGHVVGTYRMGSDADSSVTDGFGRSWDHPNLFLVGSGSFPTITTANPTLTIAALALRTADAIIKDLN